MNEIKTLWDADPLIEPILRKQSQPAPESETPRTDAAMCDSLCNPLGFARQLERDLAQAKRERDEAVESLQLRIGLHDEVERAGEALADAARRSLSWLTSYPGNAAMGMYNETKRALAQWEEQAH